MTGSLTGRWKGSYSHLDENGQLKGSPIDFIFELEEDEDASFEGRSIEPDAEACFQDPILVSGFMEGSFISFIKKYPSLLLYDPHRGYFTDPEKEHPDIEYEGEVNEAGDGFTGTFMMYFRLDGEDYLQTGSWMMSRVN